jgi:Uma2 family endonuclease
MTSPETLLNLSLPDHTQLPDSDGTFVKNLQEHPQSVLLTDSIEPVLQQLHPEGNYCIGQDSGIYWRLTDPPERGAIAPDWFYVPNVPSTFQGQLRRSYVLWQEYVAPLIVLEFVSGDGSQELDQTPITGKFWVYEQAIRVPFYGIFNAGVLVDCPIKTPSLQMYHLIEGRYEPMQPNESGRYPIPPLGVELGIWHGCYLDMDVPWLRWWDAQGRLLLTGGERAQKAEARAQQLAERLRALGVDPDAIDEELT